MPLLKRSSSARREVIIKSTHRGLLYHDGVLVQTSSTGLAYENADGWFFADGDQTWTLETDGSAALR